MDFGYHNASFRYHGSPDDRDVGDAMVARARFVEDAGFSWYSLMDHFWQLPGHGHHDEPFVECYSGLCALASATSDLELSALVTCTHYRNPAMLAKTVASLDALSGGRAVLAIGAGWYEAEYDAVGIDFPDAATRIRQCRDAIDLCRAAWERDSPVDYDGEYYDLDGLYCEPSPADVPVLVGGGGEELTLRLAADRADRWNVPTRSPERYAHKLDVLAAHCERYDRDLSDLELTVTLSTVLRETTEAAHEAYEDLLAESESGPGDREPFRGLVGAPAEVAELVAEYESLGVDALQIEPPKNDRRTTELFVDEVAPAF
ncbi:MAG: LLM class flavin-dependent oxidoreductase [Halobacteriaceae archaeon]